MSRTKSQSFIGIDVSKQLLEIAAHERDYKFRCPNQPTHFGKLIAELISLRPALIVMEATGGFERSVASALAAASLPVVIVNPRQVRAFAKAIGQLAKTDRLDARVLAHFAAAIKPPLRPLKSQEQEELDALTRRRRQLVEMLTEEKNRRSGAPTPGMRDQIEEHIGWLGERIAVLDKKLKGLLKRSTCWQGKYEILQSAPGIGTVVSAVLIAELPELGTLNRQQISKLVGIAPLNRDSGKLHGPRHIYGGRANVRRMLYMAALTAVRTNSLFKNFYQRLRANHKPYKVALTACMRKLLTILNLMVRRNSSWKTDAATVAA